MELTRRRVSPLPLEGEGREGAHRRHQRRKTIARVPPPTRRSALRLDPLKGKGFECDARND
jgi:hypothetical protein